MDADKFKFGDGMKNILSFESMKHPRLSASSAVKIGPVVLIIGGSQGIGRGDRENEISPNFSADGAD